MAKNAQSFQFCGTAYNLDREEVLNEFMLIEGDLPLAYGIFADEVGETLDNPHVQFYIELKRGNHLPKNGLRPTSIRNHSDAFFDWHFEKRLGTQAEAIRYCYKEDAAPLIYGIPDTTGQGTRTDLLLIRDEFRQGRPLPQIADAYFGTFATSFGNLQRLYDIIAPYPACLAESCPVQLVFGPSGSGKDRFVDTVLFTDMVEGTDYYELAEANSAHGSTWWDGYRGEPIIYIRELKPGYMQARTFLKLCDRKPLRVQYKCGSTVIRPKRILINTSTPPVGWFNDRQATSDEVCRRITELWTPSFPIPASSNELFTRSPLVADGSPSSPLALRLLELRF